jgi:hypothetical protein
VCCLVGSVIAPVAVDLIVSSLLSDFVDQRGISEKSARTK